MVLGIFLNYFILGSLGLELKKMVTSEAHHSPCHESKHRSLLNYS